MCSAKLTARRELDQIAFEKMAQREKSRDQDTNISLSFRALGNCGEFLRSLQEKISLPLLEAKKAAVTAVIKKEMQNRLKMTDSRNSQIGRSLRAVFLPEDFFFSGVGPGRAAVGV